MKKGLQLWQQMPQNRVPKLGKLSEQCGSPVGSPDKPSSHYKPQQQVKQEHHPHCSNPPGAAGAAAERFRCRRQQHGDEYPQGERSKQTGHQPDQGGGCQYDNQKLPEPDRGGGMLFHRIPPTEKICSQYTKNRHGL